MSTWLDEFHSRVRDWLNTDQGKWARYGPQRTSEVVQVDKVEAYGTDWAGDTEGGFHSESDLTIHASLATGATITFTISGEQMGELWAFVLR